jgi:hypothetical protein
MVPDISGSCTCGDTVSDPDPDWMQIQLDRYEGKNDPEKGKN